LDRALALRFIGFNRALDIRLTGLDRLDLDHFRSYHYGC
jgi:hypothetical protein